MTSPELPAVPVLILLAVAGGCGAATRFVVDTAVARRNRLSTPLGTIAVNTSACLLMGLLTGLTAALGLDPRLATVLGVGFLGGYSTFSTASVEAARLLVTGRPVVAVLHAAVMLGAGLAAAAVGLALTMP